MNNPYETLGVPPTASADEIRKAYRKLAKQHHPDLNPGKAESERRFKDVTAAYDLLSDPDKRARFDRGEIDAAGQERGFNPFGGGGGPYQGGGGPFHGGFGRGRGAESFSAEDLQDAFGNLFGNRGFGGFGAGGGPRMRARGGNLSLSLPLDFVEAAKGGKRRVTLPDGRSLDVDLPAGLEDGATVRLKGQGLPGTNGGPPGDALITVSVRPHPWFRREGSAVHLDLPVTLAEAVLGARVRVPTVDGPVMLAIPRGANNGTRLRLKGKGIAEADGRTRGDQYVTVRIALPEPPDPALEAFVKGYVPPDGYDPRKGMEG